MDTRRIPLMLMLLCCAPARADLLPQWLFPLDAPAPPLALRSAVPTRAAGVDPHPLLTAQTGDLLPLDLGADQRPVARITFVQRNAPDRLALGGHLLDDPTCDFTLVVRAGRVAANITRPDRSTITLRPSAGPLHLLADIPAHDPLDCDVAATQDDVARIRAALAPGLLSALDPAGPHARPEPRTTCPDDPDTIDLMIVYTPLVREVSGGTEGILTIIDLFVAYANLSLANTQISPRINLVHTHETDYVEIRDTAANVFNQFRNPGDGVMDEVHYLRNLYGADVVGLIVDDYFGNPGAATIFGAWFTTEDFIGHRVGQEVFAHEVGHCLGSHHNRDFVGSNGPGVFPWARAYRFTGLSTVHWLTAVAAPIALNYIPHYSNPLVLFDGMPTGVHFEAPDSADNGRAFSATGPLIANWRLRDCNCNGVLDRDDVLAATSNDCNNNAIPDECENDCNGNALADECDLAAPAATFYRNADAADVAFLPTAAPLADDLHLASPGALTGFDLAYFAPNSFTEPLRLTVNIYATDAALSSLPPDNLIESWVSPALPIGRRTYTRTLPDPLDLPPHLWLEIRFNDPAASVVFAPPDPDSAVGSSADLIYARLGVPEHELSPGFHSFDGPIPASFAVTLDGLAAPFSPDCNGNDVPDECDIASGLSGDCQPNGIPDDCEPDCNANGRADECDLADGSSVDCQNDGIPDECQMRGPVLATDFDDGLPPGWTTSGLWHVTTGCAQPEPCGTPGWAYFGRTGACNIDAGHVGGALSATPVYQPPDTPLTIEYCSVYRGESGTSNVTGFDWAWLSANGVQIEDVSITGDRDAWEQRAVAIPDFPGGALQLAWHFDTRDDLLNAELGWQIDAVRLIGSLDCNVNGIPDDCDLADGTSADCDGNAVPDECDLLLGPLVDTNANGVLDACEVIPCVCGDLNLDGRIDIADFQEFVACFDRRSPDTACPIDRFPCADLDADGWISLNDYATFVILFAIDPVAASPPDCLTDE